jgi:hypothetical protein
MTTAHPLLGGRTPQELAGTEEGARRVEALFRRFEYGFPACASIPQCQRSASLLLTGPAEAKAVCQAATIAGANLVGNGLGWATTFALGGGQRHQPDRVDRAWR